MNENELRQIIRDYVNTGEGNFVGKDIALTSDLAGLRIFDEPLVAFADAHDRAFLDLKKPEAIGSHFMLPEEWLPGAKTVISIFLPFTERVKASNRENMEWPSNEWFHGRIEGQSFIEKISDYIVSVMEARGYACVSPAVDPRFTTRSPFTENNAEQNYYTSNWSERHVANVCGLGTFGLSRGIITQKGIAGRFVSFVTNAGFPPTERAYKDLYEYCIHCGCCVRNCPAKAISEEEGKKHPECFQFLEKTRTKERRYYGCGKCQVKVPCESGIPARA